MVLVGGKRITSVKYFGWKSERLILHLDLRAIVCKNQTIWPSRDSDGREIFFLPDMLEVYISEKRV